MFTTYNIQLLHSIIMPASHMLHTPSLEGTLPCQAMFRASCIVRWKFFPCSLPIPDLQLTCLCQHILVLPTALSAVPKFSSVWNRWLHTQKSVLNLFPSYNIDVYCECISGVHHGHYTYNSSIIIFTVSVAVMVSPMFR